MTYSIVTITHSAPGTRHVSKSKLASVSMEYFCNFHQTHIRPEWIAVGGSVVPACHWCLGEEVKDPPLAEVREEEEDTVEFGGLCMHIGCTNQVNDNVCQFCGYNYCDKHMSVPGTQGLCQSCGRD